MKKKNCKKKPPTLKKGTKVQMMSNFSSETTYDKKLWEDIFKMMKIKKNCQLRVLYI